jgi:glycolate oxidase FAD binding subunit
LRGIREHSPGDFTVTVGAGTPLEELQEALAPHRQWLAVDPPFQVMPPVLAGAAPPPSPGLGSVGGLVARGLAGGYRERYLGVRDQLIGLRLLRADGVEAMAGGKVVKNVAGYDLMRLLCGSWGSLGLITEVTLRTLPVPPQRQGVLISGGFEDLMGWVARLLRHGPTPERLDLWSPALAAAAGQESTPLLLVGLAGVNAESLGAQVKALTESLSGGGAGAPSTAALRTCSASELASLLDWSHRSQQGPAATSGSDQPDGASGQVAPGPRDPAAWLLRLGVMPNRGAELLAHPALAGLPVTLAAGSGLGLAWADGEFPKDGVLALRRHCQSLGGHLTVLRQPAGAEPALPAWQDAPSRPMIEAIKARFDPKGQLAPGRLPGVERPVPTPTR